MTATKPAQICFAHKMTHAAALKIAEQQGQMACLLDAQSHALKPGKPPEVGLHADLAAHAAAWQSAEQLGEQACAEV